MAKFVIDNISSYDKSKVAKLLVTKGIYIGVINVYDVPPHLTLIVDGSVFSLSVKGAKINSDVSDLLRLIKKRRIKALFFALESDGNNLGDREKINKLATSAATQHAKITSTGVTCLFPIKEFCKSIYGIDISQVYSIFDLLPLLYERKLVKQVFHINLDDFIEAGKYVMCKYTMADINNMINNLKSEFTH